VRLGEPQEPTGAELYRSFLWRRTQTGPEIGPGVQPFELISKEASPLLSILERFLSPEQLDWMGSRLPRRTYAFTMGTYLRLLPDAATARKYLLWDKIHPRVLAELRAGEADLLLDTAVESIFLPNRDHVAELRAIYEVMAEQQIPPQRVVLATNNMRAPALHQELLTKLKVPQPMRLWCCDFVFAFAAEVLAKDRFIQAREADGGQPIGRPAPSKHFLFLNRKVKRERVRALLDMAVRVGLDKAYVSLLGDGGRKDGELLKSILQKMGDAPGRHDAELWRSAADDILARFPIELEESRAKASYFDYGARSLDTEYYEDSFLSLVSETLFGSHETLLITEKTLKPLHWHHPFIVIGDPGTLNRLRELGFRSFSPVINEAYDEIFDPRERLEAISDEVARIGSWNAEQLTSARQALADVVHHNFEHLRQGFRGRFAEVLIDTWETAWRESGGPHPAEAPGAGRPLTRAAP
jgi:hypothetical protein